MKTIFLCATIAIGASSANAAEVARPGSKLYGDAERGRAVVGMWCAGCHAAGDTLNDRIPSFSALAKSLSRSEGAVRAFLMQPHKPMPPLELSTQQIEDIVAYLRTVPAGAAR